MEIIRTLHARGHVAYLAGGCVRDELLGREPEDYDVATEAHPDAVVASFPRSGEVGKSFGVVIVRLREHTIEVATFRSDGPYSDRRRPDAVVFSSPEEDAKRRDYTVNALFLDPLASAASGVPAGPLGGRVIDFVGGLADLAARRLHAVGDPDARLAEDHLRALRAARLAAKLGFEIDPGTAAAIRRHAAELKGVSRERIGEEVRRMFGHPSRARAAALLRTLDLESPMLGRAGASPGDTQFPRLSGLVDPSFAGALAAWSLDLDPHLAADAVEPLVSAWRAHLCLSNADRDRLKAVLRQVFALRQEWPKLRTAERKLLAASSTFDEALAIRRAENSRAAAVVEADVASLAASASGLAPPPLLTGDDLHAMGLKPGPAFKQILDAVYHAQLEEKVSTPEEARELARRLGV